MGIEYRADVKLNGAVDAWLDGVANGDAWSVVSRGKRDLVLRWAAHVGTETLSDATIEVEPDSVFLTVHAGTRRQRELLVRRMTGMLQANGVQGSFKEI